MNISHKLPTNTSSSASMAVLTFPSPEFRKTFRDISPQSIEQAEVDMLDMDYLDSATLGMLLLLSEHLAENNQLTHTNELVIQVLDIANFGNKFDIR